MGRRIVNNIHDRCFRSRRSAVYEDIIIRERCGAAGGLVGMAVCTAVPPIPRSGVRFSDFGKMVSLPQPPYALCRVFTASYENYFFYRYNSITEKERTRLRFSTRTPQRRPGNSSLLRGREPRDEVVVIVEE